MEQTGAGTATAQQRGDSEGRTPQKPSIGRIVVYNGTGGTSGKGTLPALIQGLNAESTGITLCVFTAQGPLMQQDVQYGPGPGQWLWPERT